MFTNVTTCILFIFPLLFLNGHSKDCLKINSCSCSFDDGSGSVDLTSLGNTDGTPRFRDVFYSDEGYYYSYNPCGGFTEGDCNAAAACISNQDKSEQQQIGDASSAAFKYDGSEVVAAYTSGAGVLRLTEVKLICDPKACVPVFEPQGEQAAGQFGMKLTTICACPGMCDSTGPKSNCSGGSNSSMCFTKSAEFTKRCDRAYDGKEEPIKVLIIDNWDGVCKFPDNDDVALSLNNNISTCEDVINRCNPSQPFSVNGYICKAA
ncbi:uncharacterized protein LOC123532304 [Mercenaria mercenaria]|uniref:uncharacterized protein LOC123532304 n=1 Tax=Mercenaria mercenaria TaxID=6596 RepID=UPI00234EF8AA|nr:uncharacterized protein LOC123532304 [Mercenaria mercenaria]